MPLHPIKTIDLDYLLERLQDIIASRQSPPSAPAPAPPPEAPPSGEIEEYPVSSSCVAHISYDPEAEEALVQFTDGTQYILPGFPRRALTTWLNAKSMGAYWNKNLRGRY
jgi:hypothetical protein